MSHGVGVPSLTRETGRGRGGGVGRRRWPAALAGGVGRRRWAAALGGGVGRRRAPVQIDGVLRDSKGFKRPNGSPLRVYVLMLTTKDGAPRTGQPFVKQEHTEDIELLTGTIQLATPGEEEEKT
ncbi:hypothetical protein EYF80_049416 [Liparis tanakae]|uniref:Uncharacterized protein n=1 Tax=Liparis tanakae TaxID=230148 RepID=A0A4Z2FJE7_9TELE|nr:hypothetical protein EYF80_049416 [Liparis tanakae]